MLAIGACWLMLLVGPASAQTTTTTPEEGPVTSGQFEDFHAEVLLGLGLLVFIGSARLVASWRQSP